MTDTQIEDEAPVADDPQTPWTLPEFEGQTPTGVKNALTGTVEQIHRAIHHGERLTLVVEVELTDVAHPKAKKGAGIVRKHKLSVLEAYEIPGKPGRRLLSTQREAYRLAEDTREGRAALPFAEGMDAALAGEDAGLTDGSGVVMTPEEMAELGLSDASKDPVVVEFAGGSRAMWPDDWGKAPPARPALGDRLSVPGTKDEDSVLGLVDPETGNTVEEWSLGELEAYLAEREASDA